MKDKEFVRDLAESYANVCLIDRNVVASVHLEDRNDEVFWNTRLQKIKPGTYNFIYHSRVGRDSEKESSGCNQCLSFIDYFSNKFFACMDSDYRFLLKEKDYCLEHFIIQTNTYSWENHICEAHTLQKRFDTYLYKKVDTDFNFLSFLSELSDIIYIPLLYLLYFSSIDGAADWNIKKFNACIPSQFTSKDVSDNGYSFLNKTNDNFKKELLLLRVEEQDFEEYKKTIAVKSINNLNAYLHIQGHKIYGLVKMIGHLLQDKIGESFSEACLLPDTQLEGYCEIDQIYDDLSKLLL